MNFGDNVYPKDTFMLVGSQIVAQTQKDWDIGPISPIQ